MPEPFFENQVNDLLAKLEENYGKYYHLKSTLNGSRSFEELFTLVFDLEECQEVLVPFLLPHGKDAALADSLRKIGTDHYKKKEYLKALDHYNCSILSAPHLVIRSNEESASCYFDCGVYSSPRIKTEKYGGVCSGESIALAMGYANRSAALMKIKMYDESLRDIDRALKYGYPEKFVQILEERRLKCLKAQEKLLTQQSIQSEAGKNFKQEINALSHKLSRTNLTSELQEISRVNEGSDSHLNNADENMWKRMLTFKEEEPPKLAEYNPKVPSLSNALSVAYHPSKGRYVIAARNIRPGEVLGVESAYCVSLHGRGYTNHCSSCLCFCIIPLPCPSCTKAVFCSESCRTTYLEEDHWIECAIRPSVVALGLENQNMIYKVFKNCSYRQFHAMLKELQMEKHKKPETFGFDKNGVYSSTSYQPVHYLHTFKERMPFKSLFTACLQALVFTRLLQLSMRFFVDESGKPFGPTREDLLTTGAVLLANIFKIQNNGRFITNYKMGKTIGNAIYPALSLLNHECNPSAFGYNRGRLRVLRSLKPILRGEEVTICYTKHFQEQDIEGRRKALEHYGFSCNCQACTNHWPLFSNLPIYELHSNLNVARQVKSRILQKISNALVLSYKIRNTFTKEAKATKQDFDSLCNAIEMMYKYVSVPCQNICNLQVSLMMCFLAGC